MRASRERESCAVVSWLCVAGFRQLCRCRTLPCKRPNASSTLRIVLLDHDSKHRRVPEMFDTRHVRD
jgi:hypothetical protein